MNGSQSAAPWWTDRPLVAAIVVFLAWSLLALTWPLSGDMGVFGWIADTVHRGGTPYADAWDTKGPAAWLPSLLVQWIAGRNTWVIRVFDIAMVVAAATAMRSIARHLGQHGSGRVATMLFLLWYASLDYWSSAQPDGWTGAWLVVATACALRGSIAGAAAAGALVGFATMGKPFYLGYLVVTMLAAAATRAPFRRHLIRAAAMLFGMVAVIAALLLFMQLSGALPAYLDVQRWNRDVYAGFGDPWLTRIPAAIVGVLVVPWGLAAPAAMLGVVSLWRTHRLPALALLTAFLGAVAGVMLQGKGWTYHWLPMLPFLALLADAGFAMLRREVAGEIAATFRTLALGLALTVAALAPAQRCYRFLRSHLSAEAGETYERREFRYYGRHRGGAYQLVDSLASLEPQRARIMLWAMHQAPYLHSDLTPPTRFSVIRPLYDGPGSAYRARYRAQFLDELRADPPRWWLLPTPALLAREAELRDHDLEAFPAAAGFLRERYRLAGQSEEWQIWERQAGRAEVP